MSRAVPTRYVAVAVATLCLALLAPSYAAPARSPVLAGLPQLVLWAWERPVDLGGLGDDAAVAFLAQTFVVDGQRLQFLPRRQPLKVSRNTPLIAVTRVETRTAIGLMPELIGDLGTRIAATGSDRGVVAIQIDFDARRSERPFYAALLAAVRKSLDDRVPLTITALASWCMGDNWLVGLPIDEAVPMLFRMGPFQQPLRRWDQVRVTSAACAASIGVSLDEPIALSPRGRRVYVFNPKPWTDATVADARRLVTR